MEYKETVRAVFDNMVADIYKVEKANFYVIFIYEISDDKKTLIAKKIRPMLKGHGYQSIRDEIKEKLFHEAHDKKHLHPRQIENGSLVI
ncbi:MAG: hypothetical protein ACFFDK_05200 [Promethearchaeota archaeon]